MKKDSLVAEFERETARRRRRMLVAVVVSLSIVAAIGLVRGVLGL